MSRRPLAQHVREPGGEDAPTFCGFETGERERVNRTCRNCLEAQATHKAKCARIERGLDIRDFAERQRCPACLEPRATACRPLIRPRPRWRPRLAWWGGHAIRLVFARRVARFYGREIPEAARE